MSSGDLASTGRSESPDPSSHATNIYDTAEAESEWLDEEDDDDMDFQPTTDDSEDAEFFDPAEDAEAEFHGSSQSSYGSSVLLNEEAKMGSNRRRRRLEWCGDRIFDGRRRQRRRKWQRNGNGTRNQKSA